MEEILEIKSCIEILANDIKVNTADEASFDNALEPTQVKKLLCIVQYITDSKH